MSKRRKFWKVLPIVRAIAVLSTVGLITTTVTFAAIQSNGNALTGNTIQTATAALKISKDNLTYADTMPGYNFGGILPGGAAQPANGYDVFLKNTGSAALHLSLAATAPPTITGVVDLAKVDIILIPALGGGTTTIPLASLIAGSVDIPASSVSVGAIVEYRLQVSMTVDAVTGNSASISNLDLSFTGKS